MNRPLAGLLLALFAGGFAAAPVRALLPPYVEGILGQPPLLTSSLLSIQLACGGAFALVAGGLVGRVGQRAAVLVGLTTPIWGAALFALDAPAALAAAAVLWGLAGGFQSAGGQSFMLAAVSRTRVGSATAAYFVSGTASGALGAYAAGLAADRFGFASVALGGAALGAAALLLAVRFLPPLESRGAAPGPGAQAPDAAGYGALVRRPEVLALCAARYFPTVAWGSASLAIPLLIFRLSGTAGAVGTFSMVSLLCASLAQIATGRLIDRRAAAGRPSARPLVAPLALAILACSAGAAFAAAAGRLWPLCAAGTLWAMAAWALSTTMPPLIRELGSGVNSGRLVGLTHLLWSAGMLCGTVAAGALIDLSPLAPFALAAACLVVTAAAGLWLARRAPAETAAPSPATPAMPATPASPPGARSPEPV
jgi:MFS family permease